MLSLTKMLTDTPYFGDELRYTAEAKNQKNGVAPGRGPVVVWNYTRTCNLRCVHCYSSSEAKTYDQELTTIEALKLIDDLAAFQVPVLLFSGGEPLLRQDFLTLARYAASKGIRPTVSTNGTVITAELAAQIKDAGIGYVGISLDGLEATNDQFRGVPGAFALALAGIRNCCAVGQRVGLRFTLNKHNYHEVAQILDLLETENIDRICFYHLVYSGRATDLAASDLTHAETRQVLDLIIERTLDFARRGLHKEVLMVDNHADAVYLYLQYRKRDPVRAAYIYQLLQNNGGNRSGMAFANIDNVGNVHPDQFTQHHTLGNVRDRSFGEIWTDETIPLLAGLKNRQPLLQGRCTKCQWLHVCNGNFRARGEAATGDFWGYDPACFLTDAECGCEEEPR
ncbi:MAG: radical SAM protein [Acidaminococcaceae bacterium]